jgi:hypothetical protein
MKNRQFSMRVQDVHQATLVVSVRDEQGLGRDACDGGDGGQGAKKERRRSGARRAEPHRSLRALVDCTPSLARRGP